MGDSIAEKVEIFVDLSAAETVGVVLQVDPAEILLLDVVLSECSLYSYVLVACSRNIYSDPGNTQLLYDFMHYI